MIRFNEENWKRFDTHNKKTTIRFREIKTGIHSAGQGSMQWGNWKSYGKVYVHPYMKKCKAKNLTDKDAVKDGFKDRDELLWEISKLNPQRNIDEIVYVHPVEKWKNKEVSTNG